MERGRPILPGFLRNVEGKDDYEASYDIGDLNGSCLEILPLEVIEQREILVEISLVDEDLPFEGGLQLNYD